MAVAALQAGARLRDDSGGGWLAAITYILGTIAVLLVPAFVAVLRYWPIMRKLRNEADNSLRGDLLAQVAAARDELRAAQIELRDTRIAFDRTLRRERVHCDRRISGMQGKMDAMTRQFVAFQLVVARFMPTDAATSEATAAADRMLSIINTDVSHFEPPLELDEPEGLGG